MANLPLELLEQVVHNLSDDGFQDIEAIRACSLVSPSLRFLSQKQLFSRVQLSFLAVFEDNFIVEDPLDSEGHRLLKLLTSHKSSHLALLVRTVVVHVDEWREGDVEDEYRCSLEAPWYTWMLGGKPLSLAQLLPKLVNIRSLCIRHNQYVDCRFHEETLNAFCATGVISLQMTRFPKPPLNLILGNKHLRHLSINHKTQLVSSDPGFIPEDRLKLAALRVGDTPPRSWALKDAVDRYAAISRPSTSDWIANPNCIIDVTQLSRLEVYQPFGLSLPVLFHLCASTLKELVANRTFEGRFEEYGQPPSYREIMESLRPSLDLSLFQSLSRLELNVTVERHGLSPDHYCTSFGDLYASLQTIPDHSTISTIVLWIHIHPEFKEEKVMDLDFSPLSETLVVDGSERVRLVNLTYLEVIFHHAFRPTPPLDTHEDLLKLKQTGVLLINYVYTPPVELVMR